MILHKTSIELIISIHILSTNSERNSAIPMTIWCDGAWGVPIACLKKERTMTKRVNEVVIIRMAGAKVRTVSKNTIWRVVETCLGVVAVSTEILIPGKVACA